jgi:hypothetical protein
MKQKMNKIDAENDQNMFSSLTKNVTKSNVQIDVEKGQNTFSSLTSKP